jgi:hypothetical protein
MVAKARIPSAPQSFCSGHISATLNTICAAFIRIPGTRAASE